MRHEPPTHPFNLPSTCYYRQAFATDSRDQSPWMYYRWLVGNSLARLEAARGGPAEEAERSLLQAVLEREVRGGLHSNAALAWR